MNVKIKTYTNKLFKDVCKQWQLYAMLAIPVLYLLVMKYYPMYGLRIIFMDFKPTKGFDGSEWVGLNNFIRFFKAPNAWMLVKNTMIISVYSLFISMPFSIVLALCMNYCRSKRLTGIVRTVTYLPHFLSTVIVVSLVTLFFNGYSGLFTRVIEAIAGEKINVLQGAKYYRHVFVWSGVWRGLGWGSILYYAALSAVDRELHEAAAIDGASKWKRIWHIDLPTITPTIVVQLIIQMGGLLSVNFEKSYLLQNESNLQVSEVLSTYEYYLAFATGRPLYSYPATIGFIANVVTLVLIIVTNKLSKKVAHYGLW